MIEILKANAATSADRIDAVSKHFYMEQSTNPSAISTVLTFYHEMASGVFEGYIAWVLEEQKDAVNYLKALQQHLIEAGANEMAEVVRIHGQSVWDASQAFEQQQITEDEYIAIIELANAHYFKQEDTFREQMELYMERVFHENFKVIEE